MNPAIARLDATLATPAPRTERAPRLGTKQEQVLAMLRRADGASGPQIAEATGWNHNTVRGFLAGLKKKGIRIETLERVRMVGPNREGAKGSYSVYRIHA
jgi:biotin operon repressor